MTRELPTLVLPKTGTASMLTRKSGDWHYSSQLRSRGLYWLAILASVGFHVVILFGFNRRPAPARHVVEDDTIAVKFIMPDMKDLEEPEKALTDDDPPPDAGLPVPTLPDVPIYVDLSSAFVQPIDYNSLQPPPDLSNAAKTITIPANISRGNRLGEGMKNLFNLADLDRAPAAVVQVKPSVPASLKRLGGEAEVRIAFIVDTEGRVINPTVISSTNSECENPAVIALAKWKFRPGMKAGRRVNTRMMQPIIFNVSSGD